jgi:protein-S-isoprenylcysteine O-methyltransferase Ste14
MERSIKEKKGEHPFGDAGQLMLLGLFLIVWAGDSFFLHKSTFLSGYLPLSARLVLLGGALVLAAVLFKSGHVVVSQKQRLQRVVAAGAFRYVRHPLYLASIVAYLGLIPLQPHFSRLRYLSGYVSSTITSQATRRNCWR